LPGRDAGAWEAAWQSRPRQFPSGHGSTTKGAAPGLPYFSIRGSACWAPRHLPFPSSAATEKVTSASFRKSPVFADRTHCRFCGEAHKCVFTAEIERHRVCTRGRGREAGKWHSNSSVSSDRRTTMDVSGRCWSANQTGKSFKHLEGLWTTRGLSIESTDQLYHEASFLFFGICSGSNHNVIVRAGGSPDHQCRAAF
jgi:hypothetical protein